MKDRSDFDYCHRVGRYTFAEMPTEKRQTLCSEDYKWAASDMHLYGLVSVGATLRKKIIGTIFDFLTAGIHGTRHYSYGGVAVQTTDSDRRTRSTQNSCIVSSIILCSKRDTEKEGITIYSFHIMNIS